MFRRLFSGLRQPTWAVHALMDEPVELVCAFAAHYLAHGATEVHIALDRDDPETVNALAEVKGVKVTVCDDTFWGKTQAKRRPKDSVTRLLATARRYYNHCPAQWMLFVDSDEFLSVEGRLTHALNTVPAPVDFLRIPVIERAFLSEAPINSIFDGVFHRSAAVDQPDPGAVFAENAEFLTLGFMGHTTGKSMIRTGRNFKFNCHYPIRLDESREKSEYLTAPEYQNWMQDVWLVHYYAMTPLHLLLKRLRKMVALQMTAVADELVVPTKNHLGKQRQLATIYQNRANLDELRRVAKIIFMNREQRTALDQAGLMATVGFDPIADTRMYFPKHSFDFSEVAFNRKLAAREADMIAAAGFPVEELLEPFV